MKNKCAVCLSSYNGAKFIAKQIDSILEQKNIDIDLYIRDDGSNDQTINILKEYNKYNNIKIFYGDNIGINKSYYFLLSKVLNYDYIAFSDQDDIWDKDKIAIAIRKLKETNSDFYSSASRLIDVQGISLHKTTANKKKHIHYMNSPSSILYGGCQGCTIVMTNKIANFVFDHDYCTSYGHDVWISIIAYNFFGCVYDEEAHMSYRQHNNSWTGNRKNRIKHFFTSIYFFIKGMSRYSILATDFINSFSREICEDRLLIYSKLAKKRKSISDRITLLTSKQFKKYGFFANLVFKFYILIGVI